MQKTEEKHADRHEVWGSFLIAAAALKTRTRNGYNAQGISVTFLCFRLQAGDTPAAPTVLSATTVGERVFVVVLPHR